MRALRIERTARKFAMARLVAGISPSTAARIGPLELVSDDAPDLPGEGWRRVRPLLTGICGSDLSTVEGHASTYFDDWISFPFVPGHEVVGLLDDGTRVVLEPVLGHEARGFAPPFEGAAPGDGNDYAHLATGHLEPGIQIGFCCSTGGGWATEFVAHDSQLHPIPDSLSDESAVMVEPLAGGIHAALLTLPSLADPGVPGRPVVAVSGAGTMGLCAIAGLRRYVPGVRIVVGARYPHQQAYAKALGADVVTTPGDLQRAVRREVGCHLIGDHLSGGADATIDAIGTGDSIHGSIAMTRPRGRVVLMGMPATETLTLTGLWHRETQLVGAYTYGTETMPDGSRRRTFDLAIETADALDIGRLVSATYPLDEYEDAIAHASAAGRRGAVKVAFDLRAVNAPSPDQGAAS